MQGSCARDKAPWLNRKTRKIRSSHPVPPGQFLLASLAKPPHPALRAQPVPFPPNLVSPVRPNQVNPLLPERHGQPEPLPVNPPNPEFPVPFNRANPQRLGLHVLPARPPVSQPSPGQSRWPRGPGHQRPKVSSHQLPGPRPKRAPRALPKPVSPV